MPQTGQRIESPTREEQLQKIVALSGELNSQYITIREKYCRAFRLTLSQYKVLSFLMDRTATVPQIARRIGLSTQSVQRTVDQMGKRGLCSFLDNPDHAWSHLVVVSDATQKAIRFIQMMEREALAEALNTVSQSEIDSVLSILGKIKYNISNTINSMPNDDSLKSLIIERIKKY
jgi:DNA-binding MarR family transcriptional regulator